MPPLFGDHPAEPCVLRGAGETIPFPAGIAAGMPSSGRAARGREVTLLSWLLCSLFR